MRRWVVVWVQANISRQQAAESWLSRREQESICSVQLVELEAQVMYLPLVSLGSILYSAKEPVVPASAALAVLATMAFYLAA